MSLPLPYARSSHRRLSPEACAALRGVGSERGFGKDETLVSALDRTTRVFLLSRGLARLSGALENGESWTLGFFHPGDIVDVGLYNRDDRRCYEVTAVTAVLAIVAPRDRFVALGREWPEILELALESAREQAAEMADLALERRSLDVGGRLAHLLLELTRPEDRASAALVPLAFRFTHDDMARFVGASRPHVSSVLRVLEGEGVIRRERPHGVLVRPRALRRLLDQRLVA